MEAKVVKYCSIFDNIIKTNEIGCIIQELGGFIAPLTLYYTARKNSVNHVFIEPAMFRKRVVFTLNRFYADITDPEEADTEISDELSQLLNEYMTKKTVVIPKKDRHFFQDMTFKRLFSSDNFIRLRRKLYHKYILRREEEYDWILRYINMHVIKAIRRKFLSRYYTFPAQGDKYVYYPFHVPLDVQLTARCPEFFDQETLVGRIAGALPEGYMLYIKEHPAAIGGHSLPKLKEALARHGNIKLIHPGQNSYDIIKNAACIITVNSKVGVEAIMQGKPVVVLGKTFYREKGVTIDVEDMNDVSKALAEAIRLTPDQEKSRRFLNRAFKWSYKGELYENSAENVNDFYASLKHFLLKSDLNELYRSRAAKYQSTDSVIPVETGIQKTKNWIPDQVGNDRQ
ncbi:MAG: hypothetical protein C4581_08215 [Nitrospiraceae bacterium]|nr:MAG: hypothetical protein C4581_08215 [Nitrospiraceae bacterium]